MIASPVLLFVDASLENSGHYNWKHEVVIPYDPHDWRDHLYDIRGSLAREIFGRVATCVSWSLAVVTLERWVLQPYGWSLAIPDSAHTLLGVALGLLLVFRTNASYDRFWEGRKLWGSIVNETRNLVRSSTVCLRDSPETVRRVVAWTIVFPWTAMDRLRGERGRVRTAGDLPVHETREVADSIHPPLEVARKITATLDDARRKGLTSDWIFTSIDVNVQLLIDCIGACERIHLTPMPYAYMVHLRRAVLLYCFTLPLALVNRFGPATIPATLIIAYTLLGIEEIGVEIEDPFGDDENDLPLESICAGIESTLSTYLNPPAGKT